MDKYLYIIDIHENTVNGFSTYKKELCSCLSIYPEIHLSRILLGSPTEEFYIENKDNEHIFHIPYVGNSKEKNIILGTLLQLYISNTPNTIFFLNFSPSYEMANIVRSNFPLCKIVYTIHDFMWAAYLMGDTQKFIRIIKQEEEYEKSSLIQAIYKDTIKTIPLVNKVVCLSYDSQMLLEECYNVKETKTTVIFNGLKDESTSIRSSDLKKEIGIRPDEKIVLYTGRVSRQKGILDLMECFDSVLSDFPQCRLVIAGEIKTSTIANIKNSIRSRTLLLGTLKKVQLYEWYKIADIGILPSYYEQCSYTGIEMKMFGLPIIASDGFGINNMFDNNNSIIASIGDRSDCKIYQANLKDSIIKALKLNEIERNMYQDKSRKHYLATYTSAIMAEEYKTLIESLYIESDNLNMNF